MRLIILDGHSILYRAYHAIPPLTNKEGIQVNAVYGFVSMLLRVIGEQNPTHLVIAFDRPGGTFRNTLFADYQAQRKVPDDAFIAQIGITEELLGKMGFMVLGIVGYEADDVIGTIASQCTENPKSQIPNPKKEKTEIVIVTSDRDQLQLVTDNVRLLMPKGSLGELMLYGEKETVERMGVAPKFISDLKGLAGDPSDNIPGVAGIGPKTASDLINEFGTLEKIYENLAKIKKDAVRLKLTESKDIAFLSKKLATIVCDVPIKIELDKFKIPDLVRPDIVEALHNFGFESLVKRLSKVTKKEIPEKPEKVEEKKEEKKQLELF